MKIEQRKSINDNLKEYCHLAKEHSYMEITLWTNGEGFDVDIDARERFCLTWGEFEAVKKLVKKLNKD